MQKFSGSFECKSYLQRGRNKYNENFILKIPEMLLTECLGMWNAECFIEIFKFLILENLFEKSLIFGIKNVC